jgi:hypothetical protein
LEQVDLLASEGEPHLTLQREVLVPMGPLPDLEISPHPVVVAVVRRAKEVKQEEAVEALVAAITRRLTISD